LATTKAWLSKQNPPSYHFYWREFPSFREWNNTYCISTKIRISRISNNVFVNTFMWNKERRARFLIKKDKGKNKIFEINFIVFISSLLTKHFRNWISEFYPSLAKAIFGLYKKHEFEYAIICRELCPKLFSPYYLKTHYVFLSGPGYLQKCK
jgi:hypothetical protein